MTELHYDKEAVLGEVRRRLVRRAALSGSGEVTPLLLSARVASAGATPLLAEYLSGAVSQVCALLGHDVARDSGGSIALRTSVQFNAALVPAMERLLHELLSELVVEQWHCSAGARLAGDGTAVADALVAMLNSRVEP